MSKSEWDVYFGPMFYIRINTPITWNSIHYDLIEKWIVVNTSFKWYWEKAVTDKHIFVFESEQERMLFKLWISNNPFEKEAGAIQPK